MGVSAFTLEEPCGDGHFDRDHLLDSAVQLLGDVTAVNGTVPAAIIGYGTEAVVAYGPPDGMSWREFARTALDMCQARDDVYGIALVRPYEAGAFIYTAHFEDDQGTIDHGFTVPRAQYYTHVPQAEVN